MEKRSLFLAFLEIQERGCPVADQAAPGRGASRAGGVQAEVKGPPWLLMMSLTLTQSLRSIGSGGWDSLPRMCRWACDTIGAAVVSLPWTVIGALNGLHTRITWFLRLVWGLFPDRSEKLSNWARVTQPKR